VDNSGKNAIYFLLIIAKIFLLSKNIFLCQPGAEDGRRPKHKYSPETKKGLMAKIKFWDFLASLNSIGAVR
jgi:hypothetical protein